MERYAIDVVLNRKVIVQHKLQRCTATGDLLYIQVADFPNWNKQNRRPMNSCALAQVRGKAGETKLPCGKLEPERGEVPPNGSTRSQTA